MVSVRGFNETLWFNNTLFIVICFRGMWLDILRLHFMQILYHGVVYIQIYNVYIYTYYIITYTYIYAHFVCVHIQRHDMIPVGCVWKLSTVYRTIPKNMPMLLASFCGRSRWFVPLNIEFTAFSACPSGSIVCSLK
jgi:hypothetical protein